MAHHRLTGTRNQPSGTIASQAITTAGPDGQSPCFADLQRAIGNRAVQHLLRSGNVQAKLAISHPRDVCEQEADRVADQVLRMP